MTFSNYLSHDTTEYQGIIRSETAQCLVLAVHVLHALVSVSFLFKVEFLQSIIKGFVDTGGPYFYCRIFVAGSAFLEGIVNLVSVGVFRYLIAVFGALEGIAVVC